MTFRVTCFALLLCVLALPAWSQTTTPAQGTWTNSLVVGINASQIALENWKQGGENTVAWSTFLTGNFQYIDSGAYAWKTNLKLAYGRAKIGSVEYRKTDDEIFFESVYSHSIGWPVDPYVALQFRTQFDKGYDYKKPNAPQTSAFMDPGYLIESAGFTYGPTPAFSTRLGVAVKQIFFTKFPEYGGEPAGTDKSVVVKTGIESGTTWKVELMENISYQTQLNLFSSFDRLEVWDVRWDNLILAKVNDYISTSLNVQVVYDKAQTTRTQLKEALAVGIRYAIL